MSIWEDAADDVYGIANESESLSIDQRLKVAEIKALLSIGQELSLIQDSGINPEWRQRTS